jgi:hypothetical protein
MNIISIENDILPTLKCGVSTASQSIGIQKDTETYGRYIY